MAHAIESFATLSDDELISTAQALAYDECRATARLIAALAELDRRKLYLEQGCPSLFAYCAQVLHLSEHAAYGRIEAARLVRNFPDLLDALAEGALTLTALCLLTPIMTEANHRQLLADCRHKSKRDVERLVASVRPQPDVAVVVRKLPTPARQEASTARVWNLTDTARVESAMTPADGQGPKPPAVDPPRPAVVTLLTELMKTKMAAAERPRRSRAPQSGSRHIPAAVRREVWRRDGARCAFVGPQGRCAEHGFLELHHIVPFAKGGAATVENIALRCRAHNAYEAEQQFGPFVLREQGVGYNSVRTELVVGTTSVPTLAVR